MTDAPLTHKDFSTLMSKFDVPQGAVAVGVSGGPDSMALLSLLHEWCRSQGQALHVLSVDHGLRDAAREECVTVAAFCEGLDGVTHSILQWDVPTDTRVQEEARMARYDLIREYCQAQGITQLFLAHHADDQAETVLFRLAKGSGLDGLAGMKPMQDYRGLMLCRPFLGVEKAALVATCQAHDVPFFEDPSNEDDAYARGRLREARAVLEEEGLSNKRLAVTAKRLMRARSALDEATDLLCSKALYKLNTERVELKFDILVSEHEEFVLRVVLKAIENLRSDAVYAPRLEKVEELVEMLMHEDKFRKRTLGGLVFEVDDKAGLFIIAKE